MSHFKYILLLLFCFCKSLSLEGAWAPPPPPSVGQLRRTVNAKYHVLDDAVQRSADPMRHLVDLERDVRYALLDVQAKRESEREATELEADLALFREAESQGTQFSTYFEDGSFDKPRATQLLRAISLAVEQIQAKVNRAGRTRVDPRLLQVCSQDMKDLLKEIAGLILRLFPDLATLVLTLDLPKLEAAAVCTILDAHALAKKLSDVLIHALPGGDKAVAMDAAARIAFEHVRTMLDLPSPPPDDYPCVDELCRLRVALAELLQQLRPPSIDQRRDYLCPNHCGVHRGIGVLCPLPNPAAAWGSPEYTGCTTRSRARGSHGPYPVLNGQSRIERGVSVKALADAQAAAEDAKRKQEDDAREARTAAARKPEDDLKAVKQHIRLVIPYQQALKIALAQHLIELLYQQATSELKDNKKFKRPLPRKSVDGDPLWGPPLSALPSKTDVNLQLGVCRTTECIIGVLLEHPLIAQVLSFTSDCGDVTGNEIEGFRKRIRTELEKDDIDFIKAMLVILGKEQVLKIINDKAAEQEKYAIGEIDRAEGQFGDTEADRKKAVIRSLLMPRANAVITALNERFGEHYPLLVGTLTSLAVVDALLAHPLFGTLASLEGDDAEYVTRVKGSLDAVRSGVAKSPDAAVPLRKTLLYTLGVEEAVAVTQAALEQQQREAAETAARSAGAGAQRPKKPGLEGKLEDVSDRLQELARRLEALKSANGG